MGRLILLLLIFAAFITAIILGIMFLTKTGVFGDKKEALPPSVSSLVSAPPPASAAPSSADALTAQAVDSTLPSAFGLRTEIWQNGATAENYARPYPVDFPDASSYASLNGVTTFRGNNFRNTASWGTAAVTEKKALRTMGRIPRFGRRLCRPAACRSLGRRPCRPYELKRGSAGKRHAL